MKTKISLKFICLFALMSTSLMAAVGFTDDFNRPDSLTVGNGWSEFEDRAGDIKIENNQLIMSSKTANLLSVSQNNTNKQYYKKISFDYKKIKNGSRGSFIEFHIQSGNYFFDFKEVTLFLTYEGDVNIEYFDDEYMSQAYGDGKGNPVGFGDGSWYSVEIKTNGASYNVRVWPKGGTYPSTPNVTMSVDDIPANDFFSLSVKASTFINPEVSTPGLAIDNFSTETF